MKTLRKCIYLIFGLFIFGLVSCANDSSSSDSYKQSSNTDTDKNGQAYRDGFYKFDDGNTQMYLYYENRNLVSAGNEQGKFDSSRIEILKKSYSWNTVCKYCNRYEVSLNSTKWMLGVYPAEKLFKKGWWSFEKSKVSGVPIITYYESYDKDPSYQVFGESGASFSAPPTYQHDWYSTVALEGSNPVFISEDLDHYRSLSSIFEKGWWKSKSWSDSYGCDLFYFENLTDVPFWAARVTEDSGETRKFLNAGYCSDNWITMARDADKFPFFVTKDLEFFSTYTSGVEQ